MPRTRKLPPTKKIKRVVEVEVGYFAKDGYFSPRTPGVHAIELPWPYFRPGEKVLVEITKIATNLEKQGRNNGRRHSELVEAG